MFIVADSTINILSIIRVFTFMQGIGLMEGVRSCLRCWKRTGNSGIHIETVASADKVGTELVPRHFTTGEIVGETYVLHTFGSSNLAASMICITQLSSNDDFEITTSKLR